MESRNKKNTIINISEEVDSEEDLHRQEKDNCIMNNIDDIKMKLLLLYIPKYTPNLKNKEYDKIQEIIKNLNELKKIITN